MFLQISGKNLKRDVPLIMLNGPKVSRAHNDAREWRDTADNWHVNLLNLLVQYFCLFEVDESTVARLAVPTMLPKT
jgi:hypothetical protein